MSDEHNKTNLSDWERMLDWKYGQKYGMDYREFDYFVNVNDIDEEKLALLGEKYEIENLSPGQFPSPAFPVEGHILPNNPCLMVPLVCQWARKPDMPSINVWFLVATGSPFTCLTMNSIKKIFGDNREIHEGSLFDVAIQDNNYAIQCQVSKGQFKEANILGTNALCKMDLSLHIDWNKMMFQLIQKAARRLL